MLDKVIEIKTQANTLLNWTNEMTAIMENPYSNGLDTAKVLKDLQGFATSLIQNIESVEKELQVDEPKNEAK